MGKKSKKSKAQVNKVEAPKEEPQPIEPVKEPIEQNESSHALTGSEEEVKTNSKISNMPESFIAEKQASAEDSPQPSPKASVDNSFRPDSREEKKVISQESSSGVESSKSKVVVQQ